MADVAERTKIKKILLLTVLIGFVLISGSLQNTFACPTQVEDGYLTVIRVNNCHAITIEPEVIASCPNRACHQGSPNHQDLGGPEIYGSYKFSQPLLNSSRQAEPQHRPGAMFASPSVDLQSSLAIRASLSTTSYQALQSIRTTVLLM